MLAATDLNIQALNMDTSMNPLMAAAAAKRAKKDKANAAKRKLLPNEDASGGLLIVHTPDQTDPFTTQRAASSQPAQLSQSKPPSKKFRAESQPPTGSSRPSKPPSHSQSQQNAARKPSTSSRLLEDEEAVSHSDADVERDVRAMEDEADRLRRQSRARALLDQSLLAPTFSGSQGNGTDNNMFNFPPPSTSKPQFKPPSASKANAVGRGRTKLAITPMEVDTQVPIPQNETPQQQRNKRLREGAMNAIREEQEAEEERGRGKGGGSGQRSGSRRRASSLSRGKRISTSYQQTGVITQPHNTVSEASFYKHIDADLPEVERIRQLLIWCAMRATSTYNKPPSPPLKPLASSSSTSLPPAPSSAKPLSDPLPPLSAKAQAILKKSQDQFVKMLAEKQIDLSVQRPANEVQSGDLKENEQNVRNRNWEVTYSADIQRAQAEEEAWKKVSYEYDAYSKKLQASLEKRKKTLEALKAPRPPPTFPPPRTAKGKGKGKARASTGGEGDDVDMDIENPDLDEEEAAKEDEEAAEKATEAWLSIFPQPHELPPDFQRGADLARSILLRSVRRPPSNARRKSLLAGHSRSSLSSSSILSESEDLEQSLLSELPTLQFKLDLLHTHLNAARATTSVCERLLDERYRILNRVLDSRMRSSSLPPDGAAGAASVSATKTSVLTRYITPRARSPSSASSHARAMYPSSSITPIPGRSQSVPPPPPLPSASHLPDPHTLLRALTRIDAARSPAQISDAARRAAREVQRAEESGVGAVAGDRRVTLLPGMAGGMGVPATPRKGTLAVPGTPGRRTPGRERTPGR